jgi:hypothetical protein
MKQVQELSTSKKIKAFTPNPAYSQKLSKVTLIDGEVSRKPKLPITKPAINTAIPLETPKNFPI